MTEAVTRRPKTYHDWRHLYQGVAQSIGLHVRFLHGTGPDPRHIPVDRYLCHQFRRLDRITKRLDAEWESQSPSAMQALLEMLYPAEDTKP